MNRRAFLKAATVAPAALPLAAMSLAQPSIAPGVLGVAGKALPISTLRLGIDTSEVRAQLDAITSRMHSIAADEAFAGLQRYRGCLAADDVGGDPAVVEQMDEHDLFEPTAITGSAR